ncbi:hypothetical protein DYB37_004708 [Aphanomyces astaci]|uniref:Protein kinase domain-containing protein n=1 Tax=Aphanomyces astaci TaxID=112090 RepID=A0A418F6L7_APHAT|nr:hypothetical protein DYB37_004708 [Aphanomyces astaci]
MAAYDTCSLIYSYLTTSTSGYSCTYAKYIATNQIDLATVKKVDCTQSFCRSFLTTFASVGAYSDFGSCYLKDTSSSKNVSLLSLASVCNGIDVANTGGTNIYVPTFNPSLYPSGLVTDVQTGISTGAIVGIIVGVVVVVIFFGVVIFKYRQNNKASPPPPAYIVLNEPRQGHHATATSTAGTTSSTAATGQSTRLPKPLKHQPDPCQPPISTVGSTLDQTTSNSSSMTTLTHKSMPGQLDLCELDMHRVHPKDIHLIQPLAQGAYGEVWVAEHLGVSIAVKRLLPSKTSLADLQKFIWEIKLLSKYVVVHIVCHRGYYEYYYSMHMTNGQ